MKTPEFNAHMLPLALDLAVSVELLTMRQTGPTEADWNDAKQFGMEELGPKGDVLLYGGKGCAELFTKLARSIAVMSFCPGGVKLFGRHWESRTCG